MKLAEFFLAQLEAEAPRTRRALEAVPLGKDDWKPHAKSMPLARLAGLVASMPSWITLIIEQDEWNLTPPARTGHISAAGHGHARLRARCERAEGARRPPEDDR